MKWNWDDFEAVLIDTSLPAQFIGAVKVGALFLDPNASPPFAKWEATMEADTKFRLSWHRKRKDLTDQSASAYDMSLASIAVLSGWSDQEIVNLLIADRRKHKDDLKLRVDYYQRTIGKARTEHLHETAVNELEETLTQKTAEPESGGDRRERIRKLLREALRVNVIRVIRYVADGEESEYEIECEEGRMRIGNVGGILDHTRFQRAVAEICGKVIPMYKRDRWQTVAQSLLNMREDQPLGKATARGSMETWLRSYMTDNPPLEKTPKNIDLQIPILHQDKPYFFLGHFGDWLGRAKSEHLSAKRLGTDLRCYWNLEPTTIRHVKDGKSTTREIWPVPELESAGENV